MKQNVEKVALAYSGGLDTSIIIPWLRENYDCDVVAVCVDVGQGEESDDLEGKALRCGAVGFRRVDAVEEFAADYLMPVLRAGAIYERDYLLGTATGRPLIARKQVEIALETGCDGLAHGCTGKGNDQVRFELAYQALAPHLHIVAPWREWDLLSRDDAIDYARRRDIPVPVTKREPYSRDRNLWHTSHEGGRLEDPSLAPETGVYRMSVDPRDAPDAPEDVCIGFASGTPVSVDGEALPAARLIEHLNARAARHGVGRIDLVENRVIGIKSRGVYETPGGTLLVTALKALESVTLDRDCAHEKERLAIRYAELVYDGLWFSPLREALDAFVDHLLQPVTGTVTLRMYKGSVAVLSRNAPTSLYSQELGSFDMHGYDVTDAAGFIKLFGLPLRGRKSLSVLLPEPEASSSTHTKEAR